MKICIIGAGAMGGAIAEGLIKGDYIQNEDICVSDPMRQTRDKFANMGITATPSNQLAAQGADIVCVVVKPWLVEQVLKSIKDVLEDDSPVPRHSQYRHCPIAVDDLHRAQCCDRVATYGTGTVTV